MGKNRRTHYLIYTELRRGRRWYKGYNRAMFYLRPSAADEMVGGGWSYITVLWEEEIVICPKQLKRSSFNRVELLMKMAKSETWT
jgi:hypothetical protein